MCVVCPTCETRQSPTDLLSIGSYFIVLSIEDQLRTLQEQYGIRPKVLRTPELDTGDITESIAYANFPLLDDDVTVS